MFKFRYWRTNTTNIFGNSLLRILHFSVESRTRQLANMRCIYKGYNRYDIFNYCINSNTYSTFVEFKCWNCHTMLDTRPSLFCKNCTLIQSSDQQNFNYFELFNIKEQYEIDARQLTSSFRKLQNLIHPDKFSNKTEEEKVRSESFSSLLNKAYTTLLNPLLRGLYMLNGRGLSIEEDSITMDTSFLGEIMEWNEKVEEVNSTKSLEILKKDVDIILINLYKELSEAFNENNLDQAKVLLSKAKYFSTLLENIKEKEM
ncbi:Hypothetical protein CINCED_3A023264 [Cinara cedri]|nr:Hypothetical protein CINCED_3A023264 [Cinara cedri]